MARALVLLAAVAILGACSSGVTAAKSSSVRITRTAGLLVLPPIDRVITDEATVDRLARDILALPLVPEGAAYFCPIDFGTTYRLAFDQKPSKAWSATVDALGCQFVKLDDGRMFIAASGSTRLFSDLGDALGLAPDEVIPRPCPPDPPATHCYEQPAG